MKTSGFALLVCFYIVLATSILRADSGADNYPNILFIAVDDLRPELNCYGSQQIKSPNIDRLASGGVLFTRAYCQQAVCNPSRTSLMTGMRPDSTGVTGNHSHFRTNHPNVVTLPQHFKNHGYFAKAIGKLYHGVFPEGCSNTKWDTMGDPESWSVPATRFGPRYYYTEEGIEAAKATFLKVYQPRNPGPDDWTQKLVFGPATESPDVSDSTLYDGQVADAAIKALQDLKKSPDQPFFLAVGFIKPHSPYVAPKKYFDLYGDVDVATDQNLPVGAPNYAGHGSGELRRYTDQLGKGPISNEKQKRVRQAYYACVSYIDAQIGRVLDELDRLGLAENTIVSLYGDHGYHLGEQGLWGKTTNFELDTLVPLIVRVPGMKTNGRSSSSLVELVDLYPTLAELAGLPLIDQLQGQSFVPILEDPDTKTKDFALSQYPRGGGLMGYSLRSATHRMTHWVHVKSGDVRATELYEYGESKIEKVNLANDEQYKPKFESLSKQLFKSFGLNDGSINAEQKTRIAPIEDSTNVQKYNRDGNETSFEESKPGRFDSAKTNVGTWKTSTGVVEIDNQHAKSGKQCLQLAGGEESVVELALVKGAKSDGQLSFWAERWTSRNPFEFRISKRSNGKWSEIYNGDKKIKVGRAFLSKVEVPLGDSSITHLRFSVTSPAKTGVLIDDLRIAPATVQRVSDIEVVPTTLPALVGAPASALVKLKIVAVGVFDPISVVKIASTLEGTTDVRDIESVKIYYSGANSDFSSATLFGTELDPNNKLVFDGNQPLTEGVNYFWIACTLAKNANIDLTVGADCTEVTFSNGEKAKVISTPSIQRMGVAVRNGGDDGVNTFRIPGLVTTNRGSLIGVYDVRHRGGGDLPGDIDVGMSRSTDGGRTWEPMKIIMDMGNDPNFRHDGIGDPAVMIDRNTGTVWAAATWSHGDRSWVGSKPGLVPVDTGQFMLVKSDDDGVTWSKPINITKQVKKPEWSFLLQGPGKGITMSDGTIVFPAQYQDPPNANDKKANRLPHSSFIYSRDHGKTWNMATGAWDDTTESQIVELADGEIMINCRNNRASTRAIMTTTDMGMTWTKHPTHIKDLIEPGSCMASLINVGRELEWRKVKSNHDNRLLLFSNPDSLRGRNHMTIKASQNAGMSWAVEHQLLLDEQGGRGYSCLSMIDAETVGILYEGSQAHMTFQRVKLADILNPPKDQKTKNPAFSLVPRSANEQPVLPPRNTQGGLSIARVFGDHMVLQADQPIRVWGKAKLGAEVSLALGGRTTKITANSSGDWFANLPAQKQNSSPQSLIAKSGDATVELKDILIGQVWFCAGQSNMEWPLSKTENAKGALADSHLRLLNFVGAARGGSGVYNEKHFSRLSAERFSRGIWEVSDPQTAQNFSAVGYFFAQHLRKKLRCPIGMINVSIGGTPIESWVSKSDLRSHPQLSQMVRGNWLDNPVLDDWCKGRARSNLKRGLSGELNMPGDETGPNHSFKPGFMFAAGVEPFLPMSIKGVLWYQGESNSDNRQRIQQYDMAFPVLVNSWRSGFQNPEMPLAFVQLPAMGRPNWPLFREYQRRSLRGFQNVGMTITLDVGHPTNVHPRRKRPVGERLAYWALTNAYGRSGPGTGPLYKSSTIVGDSIVISFDEVGDGLRTTDAAAPNNFEIAGADKKFHPAAARIDRNRIKLTNELVKSPVHARYAWAPFPKPAVNLTNSAGLPASPFTTEEDF